MFIDIEPVWTCLVFFTWSLGYMPPILTKWTSRPGWCKFGQGLARSFLFLQARALARGRPQRSVYQKALECFFERPWKFWKDLEAPDTPEKFLGFGPGVPFCKGARFGFGFGSRPLVFFSWSLGRPDVCKFAASGRWPPLTLLGLQWPGRHSKRGMHRFGEGLGYLLLSAT